MKTEYIVVIVVVLAVLYYLLVKPENGGKNEPYTEEEEARDMFEFPSMYDPKQVGENRPRELTMDDVTDPTGVFPGKFMGRYPNCKQFGPDNQAACPAYGNSDVSEIGIASRCYEVAYPEYTPCPNNMMRFTQDLHHGKLRAWCCI